MKILIRNFIPQRKPKTIALGLFVFSLFLLLILLISTVIMQTNTPENEVSIPALSESSYEFSGVYFFGDSTTHGLIKYNAKNDGKYGIRKYRLSKDQILTPNSGTFYLADFIKDRITLDGVQYPIAEAIGKVKPETLIITIGLNGLSYWERDSFTKYYTALLDRIIASSPETRIILQSVFPISQIRDEAYKKLDPSKIPFINIWIKEIARLYRLEYANTYSCLADENGYLPENLHNQDGIHLNCAGYNIVLENLCKVINNIK